MRLQLHLMQHLANHTRAHLLLKRLVLSTRSILSAGFARSLMRQLVLLNLHLFFVHITVRMR